MRTSDKRPLPDPMKKVNKFRNLLEKAKFRKRWRERRLKKDVKRCVNIKRKMNSNIKKMGWARQCRRQFWRDFSRSPSLQEEIFNGIAKQGK